MVCVCVVMHEIYSGARTGVTRVVKSEPILTIGVITVARLG